eukprot:TRINITY_DN21452_c0_g1::TRINITY_DN21452_c0_g1_i1::g.10022::m.10022 TRINITY_DN21452_c0_g1::TRINITY_DN21452_c0_g1_i1::g.10022  ORF type:complete len:149 (+),score=-14.66,Herpes_LMP2/PF07415.6/0.26 TRINITY_DN21452_c0_g1_i1:107-553(+)
MSVSSTSAASISLSFLAWLSMVRARCFTRTISRCLVSSSPLTLSGMTRTDRASSRATNASVSLRRAVSFAWRSSPRRISFAVSSSRASLSFRRASSSSWLMRSLGRIVLKLLVISSPSLSRRDGLLRFPDFLPSEMVKQGSRPLTDAL